jgi:hypothetical protein
MPWYIILPLSVFALIGFGVTLLALYTWLVLTYWDAK